MQGCGVLTNIAKTIVENSDYSSCLTTIAKQLREWAEVSRVFIAIDPSGTEDATSFFEYCGTNVPCQTHGAEAANAIIRKCQTHFPAKQHSICTQSIGGIPSCIVKTLYPQSLSLLAYPIYIDKSVKGFVGFEECSKNRTWDESAHAVLSSVALILSSLSEKTLLTSSARRAQDNFSNLFQALDEFLFVGDLDGNILFVNDCVLNKLGYAMHEIVGMKIIHLHPEHTREEAQRVLTEMLRGERQCCPLELIARDGRRVPVETRVWFGTWNNRKCLFGLSKDLSREQEALQMFTKLFESNPALMAISTLPRRTFMDANYAFLDKLGYTKGEIVGKTSNELGLFVQPEKKEAVAKKLEQFGRVHHVELQVRGKDGQIYDGLFSGEIINSQNEKYFLTVMVDITEQKKIQNRYDDQRKILQSIIDGANFGTWQWSIKTGETQFNERWAKMLGYQLEELSPISIETWKNLTHPEDMKNCSKVLDAHFRGEIEFYDTELRMRHKNGNWVWIHDRGKVIEWDNEKNPVMMYGTHTDATARKETEQIIKELSLRDPLTNTYNRRYLFEKMNGEIEKFKRDNICFSLSMIDIDFFKKINDQYGHSAGDFVLKGFALKILENLRTYDFVCRYGGEEFVTIIYGSSKETANSKIQKILDEIRKSVFRYDLNEIKFTFSCGICDTSDFSKKHLSIENMIKLADARLYKAKNEGRNKIVTC